MLNQPANKNEVEDPNEVEELEELRSYWASTLSSEQQEGEPLRITIDRDSSDTAEPRSNLVTDFYRDRQSQRVIGAPEGMRPGIISGLASGFEEGATGSIINIFSKFEDFDFEKQILGEGVDAGTSIDLRPPNEVAQEAKDTRFAQKAELTPAGRRAYVFAESLSDAVPFILATLLGAKGLAGRQASMGVPVSAPATGLSRIYSRYGGKTPELRYGGKNPEFEDMLGYGVALSRYLKKASPAEQLVAPLGQLYRQSPKGFIGAETSAAVSAAGGAALAESVFPGNTTARFSAEIVGSVFNPTQQLINFGYGAKNNAYKYIMPFTKKGATIEAAKMVQEMARVFGEDPAVVARYARESIAEAQRQGITRGQAGVFRESPTLNAIFKELQRKDPNYAAITFEEYKRFNDLALQTIEDLTNAGTAESLQIAARMRVNFWENHVAEMIANSREELNQKLISLNFTGDAAQSQKIQAQASEEIVQEIRRLERRSQTIQDELYTDALDRLDIRYGELEELALLPITDTYPSYSAFLSPERLATEYGLPYESVEEILRNSLDSRTYTAVMRTIDAGSTPRPRQMYTLAKLAGSKARALEDAGKTVEARIFKDLRKAIIDDIDAIPSPELANARQYTQTSKEMFEESWVSGALPRTARSDVTRPPSEFIGRTLAIGGETAAQRLDQIANLGRLFDPNNPSLAGPGMNSVVDADVARTAVEISEGLRNEQERWLFANAYEFIENGEINVSKLERFKTKHAAVLERFPTLNAALEDAASAQSVMEDFVKRQNRISQQKLKENAFQTMMRAGAESSRTNPNKVVPSLILNNPEGNIPKIAELAESVDEWGNYLTNAGIAFTKTDKKIIADGAKGTLYRAVVARHTQDGVPNWQAVYDELFTAIPGSNKSIMDMMYDNKLINEIELSRTKNLFASYAEGHRARNTPFSIESLQSDMDMATELVAGAAGSTAALKAMRNVIPRGEAGPSLIVGNIGSKWAKKFFGVDFGNRAIDIILKAQDDAELYTDLLTMTVNLSPEETVNRLVRINASLYAAGITSDLSEEENEVIRQYLESAGQQAARGMRDADLYVRPSERARR